jgi:hypothetical protein
MIHRRFPLEERAGTRAEVAPRFRVALVGCGRIATYTPLLARHYANIGVSRYRDGGVMDA